ncbi:MAG: hypothetical protein D6702_06290 [Planctomycetota bacterium]|nr:MAG: hypothetical protein D6702_06290 [Planctomycetota bacterium]
MRNRLAGDEDGFPAAAVDLTVKLPAADRSSGLGSGRTDAYLAAIGDQNFGLLGVTAYYRLGFLGGDQPEDIDLEHGFALAVGYPFGRLSVFGELAEIWVPENDSSSLFTTWGAAWQLRPSVLLDGDFAVGLGGDAPDWQVLFGLTVNFGGPGTLLEESVPVRD